MATKKKQHKSSKGPMVGLMVVGVLGLGALAAYVRFGGADRVPPESRHVPNLQKPAKDDSTQATKVDLITPSREGTDLKLGKHESDVPKGEDARIFALNHFLQESKIVEKDARALGIQVKDGVALVDFSPSFDQSYGSFDEEALLKGICATLAQFKDIQKVQFFVDGKAIQSLGNVDLSEPIPVRESPDPASSAN